MYLLSQKPDECYGCFACIDACRHNAISLSKQSDSYLYPIKDTSLCVNCHLCEYTCPQGMAGNKYYYPKDSFAGIINNADDLKKSSSGGAFKAVVNAVLKKYSSQYTDFYCAGCQYVNKHKVVHRIVKIEDENSVDLFSKSKYVQSNPVGVYSHAKRILRDSKSFLIFSGTPCEVAALKTYLGKDYPNLFTIDLICHGAPSQEVFDLYVEELERENKAEVVEYEFRTKFLLDNGTYYTRSARYRFSNGVERRRSRLEDPFLLEFYSESYVPRPSCVACQFKRPERISDITIGDAWRINERYPQLVPTQGVSALILVSDKAVAIKDFICEEMTVYELDYKFMIDNNEPFKKR